MRKSLLSMLEVFVKGGECAHIVHAKDVAEAAIYFVSHQFKSPQYFIISCDHEPLNTFGGLWTLCRAVESNRLVDGVRPIPHLPLIVPHIFRKLWHSGSNRGDIRYSSEKIISEGFRFTLGVKGAVKEVVSSRVSQPFASIDSPLESIKERLVSGGAWAFLGKICTSLSGLAVNALLARLLSLEAMGAYFLTLSLVIISAVVAQLGMNYAVVRLVAESLGSGRPARAAKSIRLSFRYVFLGAFLAAFILATGMGAWLVEYLFDSTLMVGVMGLAALWVVVLAFQHLSGEIFRGFNDIRLASIFGGLLTSVLSAMLFAALWILQGNSDLKQVITLSITAGVTSTLIAFLLIRNKHNKIRGKSELQDKEVLSIAWPLWLTNMMLFVLIQVDLWIIGVFQPQEAVAVYGAATRFVTIVSMPLLIVDAVVPPFIAEMHAKRKKKDLEHSLRITATVAGIPSFFIVAVLMSFAEPILGLVYGDYYRAGAVVIIILSLGQLVKVWSGSCGLVLMMTGYQTRMMIITIFCGLLTIAAALSLVQSYGLVGVAAATAFGTITQHLIMVFSVKQKIGLWTHVKLPLGALRTSLMRT
jgi:O-antigen/teichoic acid export membrane protein